ncbi:MAG: 16S rRNA (adenine(1518)-N(6)/adenine(1519)-N(6))-dimethyltransferase RsmA [Armatimonadetes bacterium]|nr:16S rRNA (adenine(1518)-N(6)/adenine(1519)-N(6))-dimethyltransferase RsmA [Armatimonadota bacterium]
MIDPVSTSAVKQLIQEFGLIPSKRRGQNFLVDKSIRKRMIDLLELNPDDAAVEIGPGFGALTIELAEQCRTLTAVEVDTRLMASLQLRFERKPNVRLISASVLDLSIDDLLQDEPVGKLISNVPYVITSPLITKILNHKDRFSTILLMIQKEVAQRLSADADTPEYGSLSLFVQYHADVKYCGRVANRAFYPVPEVDSAIVKLTPKESDLSPSVERRMFKLIKAAFSMRRKNLRNNLAGLIGDPDRAAAFLRSQDIDPARRGETLTLAEYKRLAKALSGRQLSRPPYSP